MDAPPQHHSTEEVGLAGTLGLIVLGGLVVWPRLVILGFAVVDSGLMRGAFDGWVAAVAGFVVLPWTTLAYATMWSISSNEVTGFEWAFVGVAVLIDIWAWSAFFRR
jgi:hypothetical protein